MTSPHCGFSNRHWRGEAAHSLLIGTGQWCFRQHLNMQHPDSARKRQEKLQVLLAWGHSCRRFFWQSLAWHKLTKPFLHGSLIPFSGAPGVLMFFPVWHTCCALVGKVGFGLTVIGSFCFSLLSLRRGVELFGTCRHRGVEESHSRHCSLQQRRRDGRGCKHP